MILVNKERRGSAEVRGYGPLVGGVVCLAISCKEQTGDSAGGCSGDGDDRRDALARRANAPLCFAVYVCLELVNRQIVHVCVGTM